MFVGHYGPSFLAKRLGPRIPLWLLFLAVQLVDVLWAIFILLGVERVRIVPGFTETNALDLYDMPYTHSLPGAVAWAVVAGILYRVVKGSGRDGLLVGAAVFSHWPLDLLVHRPDLALYDNSAKVGFGLWDYPYVTLAVEGALLLGAMVWYMAGSRPLSGRGRIGLPAFCVVMFLMQAAMLFGPVPPSDRAMAFTALGAYALFAAAIAWFEKGRAVPPTPTRSVTSASSG